MEAGIGRYLLFTALGMFLMFIILKMMASKATGSDGTTAAFMQLARTGQALNLVRTNEFRELAKTPEFRNLVKTLANEQVAIMTNTIVSPGRNL